MIYIFCAFYAEAAGLISHYGLKKQNTCLKFDMFENEDERIRLTLTGAGEVAAAAAVSSVCTFFGVGEDDRIINIGTSAGATKKGNVFIANKITDLITGRSYYPDMILNTPIEEMCLVTGPSAASKEDVLKEPGVIRDMEAAGIYAAASYYLPPHCISFIKTVADSGVDTDKNQSGISMKDYASEAKNILEEALPEVTGYIDLVKKAAYELNDNKNTAISDEIRDYTETLSADMHCSKTMSLRLEQLIKYAILSGTDSVKVTDDMYREGILPAKDKNSGKKALDQLAGKLI